MKISKKLFCLVMAAALCLALAPPAAASDTGTAGQASIVSAGAYHSAVIDSSHSLWMWGLNNHGQLGNGGAHNSTCTNSLDEVLAVQTTPVRVLDDVISVSCGDCYTAAIKSDGTLWMWGCNDRGQLGDGTLQSRNTPVQVLDRVAAVSCGYSFTAAIRDDGSLWTWGSNLYGQLGTGGVTNAWAVGWAGNQLPVQTVPVKIMDSIAAVSCGNFHAAAVKDDGTLWTWGNNDAGQLGLQKDSGSQLSPVQTRSGVRTVCCGDDSLIFMDSGGSLTSWGSYLKPAPTWTDVTALTWNSGWYSGYVRADGSLWTRGYFHPDILSSSGEALMQLDGVYAAAGGFEHILAVRTDGSVWAWGYNGYGQAGNGGLGEAAVELGSSELMQKTPCKLSGLTAAVPGAAPAPRTGGGAVVSQWALELVNEAEKKGLMPDALAGGDLTANINRADFAAVAVRLYEALLGEITELEDNPFRDTDSIDVLKAYCAGIVTGTSSETFDPALPVTREQAAVMLTNVYTALGRTVPSVDDTAFDDNGAVSPWARSSVAFMAENGLVSGVGDNLFDPQGSASAEQALIIALRMLEQVQ